jgi:hypothetical protein
MRLISRREAEKLWLGFILLTLTCSVPALAQTAATTAAQPQADNEYQASSALLLIRRSPLRE